jgi:hypothetical protein
MVPGLPGCFARRGASGAKTEVASYWGVGKWGVRGKPKNQWLCRIIGNTLDCKSCNGGSSPPAAFSNKLSIGLRPATPPLGQSNSQWLCGTYTLNRSLRLGAGGHLKVLPLTYAINCYCSTSVTFKKGWALFSDPTVAYLRRALLAALILALATRVPLDVQSDSPFPDSSGSQSKAAHGWAPFAL